MSQPNNDLERRRAQRIVLCLEATARESGHERVTVRVVDISTHGCRIEVFNGDFAGPLVWVTIAGLAAQPGRLMWQKDGFAGLEFLTPLTEAVLDNVIANQPEPSKAGIEELRELAARTRRIGQQSLDPVTASSVLELSRDCSLRAIVYALKLAEPQSLNPPDARLTATMIRRNSFEHSVDAGFSFNL